MKTVEEFIDELKTFPQDAVIFIGNSDVEPTAYIGDFPELFSGMIEYKEHVHIVPTYDWEKVT